MHIECRKLSRRFGHIQALDEVDLTITSGRRVGLVGPNGSGKSTLIRILLGLLQHEGEVTIDGHDPRRDRIAIARRIAYVPQTPPNLGAAVSELATAVHQLRGLDTDELRQRSEDLGLDWGTIREVSFRDLSGGMKQKLLIALAMASRPELLILDEPTASLDAGTRERFFRLFAALDPSTTVILCSHRLDEMRHLIDQVISLEEGHVRYDGSAAEFLSTRAICVVEVLVPSGNGSGRWLEELGFQARLGGWWQRTVRQKEKAELLPRLARHLGESLIDLHVRDLESIAIDDYQEPVE